MTVHDAVRRLDDYDTTARHRAVVVASQRLTPDSAPEVRELVLDLEGELEVRPGQSLGVLVPGSTPFGQRRHFRLYTIADLPERSAPGRTRVRLCVRRVVWLDPYSGERYPGRASSFLCDLAPGARLAVTGPYGLPFEVPAEHDARLVLIGAGTGIAPFRAFVRHLYREVPDWRGRVWLFHGAPSGLELLYQNDERDDFAQYVDRGTFEAFRALSPRPSWADPIAWDYALEARGDELWEMLRSPDTYVYLAGHEPALADVDRVLARVAGSPEAWARRKAELRAGGRWIELIY